MKPARAPRSILILGLAIALSACSGLDEIGRAPEFNPLDGSHEHSAMYSMPMPEHTERGEDRGSLWASSQQSLLGDRRAARRGDILTVVIEIDDSAEMSNSSNSSRDGSVSSGVSDLLGVPQRVDNRLPDGASTANAVGLGGSSDFRGDGSVRRNEQLTLRLATTVVERLPNNVMKIEGSQQIRVNTELRDLLISGYVRPQDISRRNEITYDKIAGARISYGGRGLVSDAQQPRWGQELADKLVPF